MKVTFIMSSMGRKPNQKKYVKTWQMEPLSIGVLSSLTPENVQKEFFDERVEEIDFETETDLVAITVETYTARRSYEIAERFQKRGIPVIMGGFHPTLFPDEVQQFADSVVIGEADSLWPGILVDAEKGKLKKRYKSKSRPSLDTVYPDRSIFEGKDYLDLGLIETGRGCAYSCDFCSIARFYKNSYKHRPIENVVAEIKSKKRKYFFFVDDNICTDMEYAKDLMRALIPLKINWFSQGSINMANDEELLMLMKKSGCKGILIGFESLNKATLTEMKKGVNVKVDLDSAIRKIHKSGIFIYATFVFGYDTDVPEIFELTRKFALKHKFFITAFNHLVPFPGTLLYSRLEKEGRLLYDKWWLSNDYKFGDVAYMPSGSSPDELANRCYEYRKGFFNISSIFRRLFNMSTNFRSFSNPFGFLLMNLLSKIDVKKRQGIPMGTGVPLKGIDYEDNLYSSKFVEKAIS